MSLDLFTNIPPEITINILLRLPIKTILSCKYVCKSWFDLIESREFSELQLSKSVVRLVIYQGPRKPYRILELADEFCPNKWPRYHNVLFSFDIPFRAHIHSSVNGLLFVYDLDLCMPRHLYICNPITRDYIELPPLPECGTFGFGVSKITGQYKVIKVFRHCSESRKNTDCHIYTIGTRSWRSIKPDNQLWYKEDVGAFLNGNLHWLALDINHCTLISCFDLETERFSIFSSPPNRPHNIDLYTLSAFGECLCLCDNVVGELVFWWMKEYGDEKSWTKECIIKTGSHRGLWGFCRPVKVLQNGDILIEDDVGFGHIHYSNKAKTIEETFPLGADNYRLNRVVLYTPSFLSVRMLAMENATSL